MQNMTLYSLSCFSPLIVIHFIFSRISYFFIFLHISSYFLIFPLKYHFLPLQSWSFFFQGKKIRTSVSVSKLFCRILWVLATGYVISWEATCLAPASFTNTKIPKCPDFINICLSSTDIPQIWP